MRTSNLVSAYSEFQNKISLAPPLDPPLHKFGCRQITLKVKPSHVYMFLGNHHLVFINFFKLSYIYKSDQ